MQHHVSVEDRIRSNSLERKPAPNAGARREQLITTADHRWERCKLHHGAAWFFSYLQGCWLPLICSVIVQPPGITTAV